MRRARRSSVSRNGSLSATEFCCLRLNWPSCSTVPPPNSAASHIQLAVIASRPYPLPPQPRQPVIAPSERIDKSAHSQPIPIPSALLHRPCAMLQVPAQMFHLPLVRTDLPATPDHFGGVFCTNDVLVNRGRIEARQTSREQLPRFLGRYLVMPIRAFEITIRWPDFARHWTAPAQTVIAAGDAAPAVVETHILCTEKS